MRRPRDSQRQKVYNAESACSWWKGCVQDEVVFNDFAKLERYFTELARSNFWKALCNKHRYRGNVVRPYPFHSSGYRGNARYSGRVSLPRSTWNIPYICHELGHVLASNNLVAGHGPEYCRAYIDVVGWILGADAAKELKVQFGLHKVKWRKPRKISDEQRAKLRERGRKLAAGRGHNVAEPHSVESALRQLLHAVKLHTKQHPRGVVPDFIIQNAEDALLQHARENN